MIFEHCWPPWKNAFGHHLEKSTIGPFGKKSFQRPCLAALTTTSVDNSPVLHARCNRWPFVFIPVWCIARHADRNVETAKHFHNCSKVLSHFYTAYKSSTVPQQAKARRYAWQWTDTMLPISAFNFCASELCRPIVPAVFCNSYVQENMLSSNHLTSIEDKTVPWLPKFRVPLQNFRVSFWHSTTFGFMQCRPTQHEG